uniref:Uncharacterized protein n=1 Tax=Helianthus annuus TaxID=4232 RepID=A0A251SHE0_HELAN
MPYTWAPSIRPTILSYFIYKPCTSFSFSFFYNSVYRRNKIESLQKQAKIERDC